MNRSRTRLITALSSAAALLATAGCGAADMTKQASPFAAPAGVKTVTLSVQSWVGAQANVAVAEQLLKEELGYRVDLVQTDEVPAWDALSQGRVDAILEDWGHPDQEKLYIDEKKTIVRGGDLGVTGHIGWYVPKYWADKNPEVTDWQNLNKFADELKTAESGGKGQLMDGSPSYVTNDVALVKNLDLDYKVVFSRLRGGPDHPDPAVRQGEEALPQLLVPAAVAVQRGADGRGEASRVHGRVRGQGPEGHRLRVPDDAAAEVPQRRLRRARRGRVRVPEEVPLVGEGPERGVRDDRLAEAHPQEAAKRWIERHPDVWKKWLPTG